VFSKDSRLLKTLIWVLFAKKPAEQMKKTLTYLSV